MRSQGADLGGARDLRLSQNQVSVGREHVLDIRLRYRLLQATPARSHWEARTEAYFYQLSDRDGQELVLFQWDPMGRSPITTPHLHIGRSLAHPALPAPFRERVGRLVKSHLPTGHVTIAALLRTAIADLDVTPLRHDWEVRLQEAHEAQLASFSPSSQL